jgi:hypothetical protein
MIPVHRTNFTQLIDDVKKSLAAEDKEAMSLCIAPQFELPPGFQSKIRNSSETIGVAICSPRLNRFQLRFQETLVSRLQGSLEAVGGFQLPVDLNLPGLRNNNTEIINK